MTNKEKLKIAIDRFKLSWEFLKDTFAEIADLFSRLFNKVFKITKQ